MHWSTCTCKIYGVQTLRMHMRSQELKGYLRKGIRLDELWRVARGEVKYNEFASTQQNGAAAVATPPPSAPDELVLSCNFCCVKIPEKMFCY